MQLNKWFEWPPDVFALASLLFSSTGAYRRVLSPPDGNTWPPPDWPRRSRRYGSAWRAWVEGGLRGNHPLAAWIAVLEDNASGVLIDQLYDPPPESAAWNLFIALLEAMSIADEAMRGVGSAYSPRTASAVLEGTASGYERPQHRFYLQAHYLLALRGSLSRLPKYRGIVLPKARTPQVGFTLRSFSINLTFHQTELDVVWRTLPWFNFDEPTINLMIVPCPFRVEARCFQPLSNSKRSGLDQDRYFHYERSSERVFDVDALVEALVRARGEVRRVHMLVFPEMALRPNDMRQLKVSLERDMLPQHIPMIIAGVGASYFQDSGTRDDSAATVRVHRHHHSVVGYNRVVLSVYFGGKWHDMIQDKHHSWKLDSQQIEQYQLGGVLSGNRDWWEAINIVRRRASFLSVNDYLTIYPLICEDLARMEPLSELIRGVAPSMLIALLLDGPQIQQRWSSRYASVFADDPGSSVLTVTSLGMTQRSIIPGGTSREMREMAAKHARIVGQWKDREGHWCPIEVGEGEQPVSVLTVGAQWKVESAVDGRIAENSVAFIYQGMRNDDLIDMSTDQASVQLPNLPAGIKREGDATRKKLKILDMLELTLFTYYTDALVDVSSSEEARELLKWFQSALDWNEHTDNSSLSSGEDGLEGEILRLLAYTSSNSHMVPREIPSPHLILAVRTVNELLTEAFDGGDRGSIGSPFDFWRYLTEFCHRRMLEVCGEMASDQTEGQEGQRPGAYGRKMTQIAEDWLAHYQERRPGAIVQFPPREVGRIRLMSPLALIWAVHTRLTIERRHGTLTSDGADLLVRIHEIVGDVTVHNVYLDWRKNWRQIKRGKP